ncbi:MAG: molybdopterin-binding protein [Pseudomonadota bacterium]
MEPKNRVLAAVLLIGNELLSGRTRDSNLTVIAKRLGEAGIEIAEARIISDHKDAIINAVNEMRLSYDYVITTGGIGPTHDDITSESVAEAFKVPLELNADAHAIMKALCEAQNKPLNAARLRMAHIPLGARLLKNRLSGAPGYRIENVFVLAGVPMIMEVMLEGALAGMQGGAIRHTASLVCNLQEGQLAQPLRELEQSHPGIEIGSYPRFGNGNSSVTLIARSFDADLLQQVQVKLQDMIQRLGGHEISQQDG